MDHAIWIAEIRSTVSEYPLIMVYNMLQTGFFYHKGPNRTYRLESEDERAAHATKLQNQRITVVLCINADGSHALAPRYIGKSKNPRCFGDPRFAHHDNFYVR